MKLTITAEVMHNWPKYRDDHLCKQLPEHALQSMDLQHKRHHNAGISVRDAAEDICKRLPAHLEMGF